VAELLQLSVDDVALLEERLDGGLAGGFKLLFELKDWFED
jgi:hypothetical protein